MQVAIDGAGRIVIPKVIREELGLMPDVPLTIMIRNGSIVIEPSPTPMRLVKRGKGLIAEPDKPLPTLTTREVRATLEVVRR